ncbi:hypothetical protein FA15DRAFT_707770 [Coprinopsis marcescibilis]|uniref:Uncharacterized protein n=1 Tax=Coprinopsis marcescibilis TaxID=230819 RepID=A0A5C3KKE1_COPMA|nr:hypothetical protein FA15DRAFT_707770 [Coprinopsis marcescibilis]
MPQGTMQKTTWQWKRGASSTVEAVTAPPNGALQTTFSVNPGFVAEEPVPPHPPAADPAEVVVNAQPTVEPVQDPDKNLFLSPPCTSAVGSLSPTSSDCLSPGWTPQSSLSMSSSLFVLPVPIIVSCLKDIILQAMSGNFLQGTAAGQAQSKLTTYGLKTLVSVLQQHLIKAHLEEWVSSCNKLGFAITAKAAQDAVHAYREKNGQGTNKQALLQQPQQQFSHDAFVNVLADFIIADEQVLHPLESYYAYVT